MKKIIISVLVILLSLDIKADIAPNPIQAKGITIRQATEIKMTYEKVVVDLTLDSSFVHCFFRLHNEGKAQKIQIGYPNMSYYSINDRCNFKFSQIKVYENGKKLDDINFFAPDSINFHNNDNNNKPWYLWDTYFDENETRVIVISYSLPHGVVKNNLYYKFDYLLSTGAGWKGDIDTAEIIINFKNFDKDLILKTSPDNYTTTSDQIVWKLYDIEPTLKDNISISYEKEKGQYGEQLKIAHLPVWILNDKIILSNDIRDVNGNKFENLNPNEIASINVIKASESGKMKFPNIDCSNGLILIYTKRFAIEKFFKTIHSRLPGKPNAIKFSSISDFENNYSLVINEKIIKKGSTLYEEIMKIDKNSILDISIKKLENNLKEIDIKLK